MKTKYRSALVLVLLLGAMSAQAQQKASPEPSPEAQATYADIEKTLGSVPSFLRMVPSEGIAGAWGEMKSVQLSDKTALPPKTKELIGLAVAAQIPCAYCVYFHTQAAKANGATDEEIHEAIAMSALTRHWSTVLNGSQQDFAAFKKEADAIMQHAKQAAKAPAPGK